MIAFVHSFLFSLIFLSLFSCKDFSLLLDWIIFTALDEVRLEYNYFCS